VTVLANIHRFGPGPWGPGRGHMFWPFAGLLFWALLVGLVVLLAVLLLKRRDDRGPTAPGVTPASPAAPAAAESPMDVAKLRYARGELTREEFEALKQDLQDPQ